MEMLPCPFCGGDGLLSDINPNYPSPGDTVIGKPLTVITTREYPDPTTWNSMDAMVRADDRYGSLCIKCERCALRLRPIYYKSEDLGCYNKAIDIIFSKWNDRATTETEAEMEL